MIGKIAYALVLAALVPGCSSAPADGSYFPRPGDDWEHRSAVDVGMDSLLLVEAVSFAIENEPDTPRDLESWMRSRVGDDPYGELIGDLKPRGGPNGLVLRQRLHNRRMGRHQARGRHVQCDQELSLRHDGSCPG